MAKTTFKQKSKQMLNQITCKIQQKFFCYVGAMFQPNMNIDMM